MQTAPILDDFGEVQGYQQYLYKEAINCLGFDKPQGALVTTAAAKLQDKICGPYSIPAYTAEQDGRVIGSFQKKIDSLSMETDLFQWQANPQAHPPLEKTLQMRYYGSIRWTGCSAILTRKGKIS